MGMAIAKSGLFGMKTPEQAIALMLIAQAEGRHPAAAAQDYDIIGGRAAKKSEAMLRDFLAAGGKIEWHLLTDEAAEATFSHSAGGAVRLRWDMPRAVRAGLANKDNWKKWPRAMLRSRVVSEGCKTIYPVATSGMYTPEEVQDMEPLREVNKESSSEKLAQIQAEKAKLLPGVTPPVTAKEFYNSVADSPGGLDAVKALVATLIQSGHEAHALELSGLLNGEAP
jgi:hypothetical protein